MLEDRIYIAFTSAGAGALTALSFYLKNRGNEKFHLDKMLRTTLLSGTVGFIAGFNDVEQNVVIQSQGYALISVVVENAVKLITRKVVPWVKSFWSEKVL